jgi:hypothetical protein
MASTRLNSLEQFLLLFNKVKEEAGHDPGKLGVFYDQKSALRSAVDALLMFFYSSDFERRIFHYGRKYVPQAPEGFDSAWNEFDRDWVGPLTSVWLPLEIDIDKLAISAAEGGATVSGDKEAPGFDLSDELESPNPDRDWEFDPLFHDGGKAFAMAFWTAETYASEVGTDHEDTAQRAAKIGLDAYDYLQNTIGFDAAMVFRRWRQLPVIFAPSHVSDQHGLTERGALNDLLENAARAYVFGADAAAIAMCRALLETVLKKHYELEYQYEYKGELRDKGLGKLIILADEKYKFVQKTELQRLTQNANNVMHNYGARGKTSLTDEKTIVEFLKTIKFLIERAPKL